MLDLSYNTLRDLMGLQTAPPKKLRHLNLSNNELTKLEGLEHLRALVELDISRNRIRQIDP